MTGWNFSGQNLAAVSFLSATLTNANLTNANLASTNFSAATLTNANLTGATLTNGVWGAYFNNTNLTAAQLYSTASYQSGYLGDVQLWRRQPDRLELFGPEPDRRQPLFRHGRRRQPDQCEPLFRHPDRREPGGSRSPRGAGLCSRLGHHHQYHPAGRHDPGAEPELDQLDPPDPKLHRQHPHRSPEWDDHDHGNVARIPVR